MIHITRITRPGNLLFATALFFSLLSCKQSQEDFRYSIDLSGQWQLALDSANEGIEQQWFSQPLSDSLILPGTTDLNKKGYKNKDTTTLHLNRVYVYEGPAWYKKTVRIPEQWEDRHIVLSMERTKPSQLWVDDRYVGESYLLESPQQYDLTEFLTPGEHTLTLRINNDLKLTPYGNVHIYTDETQTNWNGVIGDFYLEASDKTYIKDVQVYPHIDEKKITVELAIENGRALDQVDIELHIARSFDGKTTSLKPATFSLPCDSLIELEYELGEHMELWDDYAQPLYSVNAVIRHENGVKDNRRVTFGMRSFEAKGTQFSINGRTTFLRGKHDACVFPLTGHPPMEKGGWIRMFEIAKSYGINHVRFHSWCPPEAAFTAADETGIFLQPELPFWGGLESDTVAEQLRQEGIALLKSYANHPSFVLFSPGNEIWSGHERVKKIMTELKNRDGRPLYTHGSNNNIGYVNPPGYAEFHIAARTPSDGDTIPTHTRLTHAYADSRDGGILNTQQPSADITFEHAVSQISLPLISHEIGQYQIYPNYEEIEKYTGVVQAWNLEVFRNRLEKSGMLKMDSIFQKASGAWSALCYKAEMEAAFRTEGFAGFQLLDLQDFPGQGTALVGMLDAFMDSKEVISREEWLQSCNDVVTLLTFEKYVWTQDETFQAAVEVANFSNKNLNENLSWKVVDEKGTVVHEGMIKEADVKMGKLNTLGEIQVPLKKFAVPAKLTVQIFLENTEYGNTYPLWIYPAPSTTRETAEDIVVATRWGDDLFQALSQGKKVLLMPDENSVKENSVGGLFPPDFWNYGMFKGISEWVKKPVSPGTLGILADPQHPLFDEFPTDFHTNWQWWSIVRNSRPLILDKTETEYLPVVQVIDNLERNHKLGLIFEAHMGSGKLLVCTSQLNKIMDRPEAAQLYKSIVAYMKSEQFKPEHQMTRELLEKIIR